MAALTFWRRSIQARVVASTLVLSFLVVSVVGWFLLRQTRDGLLDDRVDAVVAEALDETEDARTRLASATLSDVDAAEQQRALVEPIIQRGLSRDFAVVLAGPAGPSGVAADPGGGGAAYTFGLDRTSVPASLVDHFSTVATPSWTYTTIRRLGPDGETPVSEPGIAVGSQVTLPADGRTYTLYLLFPTSEDEETLALVTRALLTAGVLLLLLVAGVTWLVAQQVVTPIRMARRVAERLAAGQLQERLEVSGEDDLARLATSFNQMASNLQRQIRQLEELSRVQRRFVSDVSHELRTPLTTVRMAGDVLHDAKDDFDPVTARAAELLQTELDRFETLLADLLEISRFDAGAAQLEVDDVNLVDVAHRVVESTRPLADQRGVRLVVRTVPAWPRPTYAGWSASCATWSATRSTTPVRGARVRRRPSWCAWPATSTPRRWRCATTAWAWRRGSRRWCSTASGAPTLPGRARRAAPAWASPSRWRTPTCTVGGCRPGVVPTRGRSSV